MEMYFKYQLDSVVVRLKWALHVPGFQQGAGTTGIPIITDTWADGFVRLTFVNPNVGFNYTPANPINSIHMSVYFLL